VLKDNYFSFEMQYRVVIDGIKLFEKYMGSSVPEVRV
jgi:hypothetical protein